MPTPVAAAIMPHSVNELTSAEKEKGSFSHPSMQSPGDSKVVLCISVFKIK